jgi:hypothetical protein
VKRALLTLVIAIVALGAALPFAPVAFMKAPLERALERGLGRKVDVDSVSLTLFSGPGFSLDGVTIHEDPRAGIEPFAYANTLDARLDLFALLRGRLQLSSLHLNDATFNLVKPNDAPWNFQLLFNQTSAAVLPALKMRGGRVNFKFSQTKSILFFDDTDMDISPRANGAIDLRFSGVPARTDRSAQNFGHFFVRGTSSRSPAGQRLNLRVELEPSSLDALARLFAPTNTDLKGVVALDAQVAGDPSHLDVNGTVQLAGDGQWRLGYKGALDLVGQTLDLHTLDLPSPAPGGTSPLKLRVTARNLLSRPEWDVAADLSDAPLAAATDIARKLGAPIPERLSAEGTMTGSVRYGNTDGLGGNVELQDIVLTLPDAAPLKASTATVFLKGETILVGPVTVAVGEARESAEVEATYQSGESGGLQVKIATRRMTLASVRAYGFAAVPMLDRAQEGSWRGSLTYARPANDSGESYRPSLLSMWSGDFEVQNMQIPVDGLAEPVRLQSASVSLKPQQVAVTRIRAKAGAVDFSGDYRWQTAGAPTFRIQVNEADVKEIERLFRPTVSREGGLFARTLGIGSNAAVPEWLTKRHADGTLLVTSLTVGDAQLSGSARLAWAGPAVTVSAINAKLGDAVLAGQLQIDLSGRAPGYVFEGKLEDLAYKGGKLDFNGKLQAAGSGLALLASIKASGTVRGRSLALSSDSEYRRATGRFTLSMTAAGPLWKLSGLELSQGTDTFAGEGTVQADGKLALDIHRN